MDKKKLRMKVTSFLTLHSLVNLLSLNNLVAEPFTNFSLSIVMKKRIIFYDDKCHFICVQFMLN